MPLANYSVILVYVWQASTIPGGENVPTAGGSRPLNFAVLFPKEAAEKNYDFCLVVLNETRVYKVLRGFA